MIYPTGLLQSALQNRSSRALAVFLSVLLVVVSTFFIPSTARADRNAPPPPVVLVFPFTDNSSTSSSASSAPGPLESNSQKITDYVRLKIDALGYYHSTAFSRLHPSIQRALNVENTLGEAEIDNPTTTPDRAEKIASIVSAPFYLVGNIDSITTNTTAQTATVIVDGTFYETDTGAAIHNATVTGVSSAGADDPVDSAIDNASGQLIGAIVGPQFSKHAPKTRISNSHSSTNFGTVIALALAVALVFVVANNHSHTDGTSTSSSSGGGASGGGGNSGGGGGGGSGPPPPPKLGG